MSGAAFVQINCNYLFRHIALDLESQCHPFNSLISPLNSFLFILHSISSVTKRLFSIRQPSSPFPAFHIPILSFHPFIISSRFFSPSPSLLFSPPVFFSSFYLLPLSRSIRHDLKVEKGLVELKKILRSLDVDELEKERAVSRGGKELGAETPIKRRLKRPYFILDIMKTTK